MTGCDIKNVNNNCDYLCSNCNKNYKSRNGLWCHSKKCLVDPSSNKIINNGTENPDAKVNNTPNNLLKDKIYLQTLQGDERTRDKIIKNISKEVFVDKDN